MKEVHFDRYAFDPRCHRRKQRNVLTYDEFQFMQVQHRRQCSYHHAPEWVFDDKLVRKVIAAQVAMLAGLNSAPADLDSLRQLGDKAIARLKINASQECNKLALAAERIGLPAYFATLLYMTYRAGSDSVACAMQLHISPVGVRQTLHRLKETAKRIGVG